MCINLIFIIHKQIIFKMILNDVDAKFMSQISFNSLLFNNIDYYHKLIKSNIFKNDKYNENLILFHFNKFNKTLRRKKLSHLSRSYLKTFEFFKLLNIKRKIIIKFHADDFFEHFNNNFDVLLKT